MRKRVSFIVIIVFFFAKQVVAQDPYYSQYFMSPMTLNPALIGKGVSDMRVMTNRKSQWWGSGTAAAFTNTSISFEKRLADSKTKDNQLAVGVMLLSDASNSGLLKNNYISLGFAYNLVLDKEKKSLFGVGLSSTYSNRILDQTLFQTQSQFGSMGFNRSIPSYDPINFLNKTYIEVNAGVHYSYEDDNWGLNAGLGIFHASKPNMGAYANTKYSLDSRYSTQLSVFKKYKYGDELHLLSSAQLQGINEVYSMGAMYKLKIPGTYSIAKITIGAWKRFNDAIYPYFGIQSTKWIAGITYDVISSDLSTYYNSVESFEVSFAWQFTSKSKPKKQSHSRVIIY